MDYQLDDVTEEVPADAEYVLQVLQVEHRLRSPWDESMSTELPHFEMTIADWWKWSDAVSRRSFCQELNRAWELSLSVPEWNSVLEPEQSRTVGELCHFIAARAKRRVLKPVTICHRPCRKAAAFLFIQNLLREQYYDPRTYGPSSPLPSHLIPGLFFGPLAKLNPQRIPAVDSTYLQHREGLQRGTYVMTFCSAIMIGVGALTQTLKLSDLPCDVVGVFIAVLFTVIALIFMRSILLSFASGPYPQLKTYRDLATILAGD